VSLLEKGGVQRDELVEMFSFDKGTVTKRDLKILSAIGCKNLGALFHIRYNNQEKGPEIPDMRCFFKNDGFNIK
ncbi:MAG: hypothetical protein PHE27_02410, partial [Alphaproteobacteria bacterium]|nr:hypothetical protein [Alphaproteobacteria bacterium]